MIDWRGSTILLCFSPEGVWDKSIRTSSGKEDAASLACVHIDALCIYRDITTRLLRISKLNRLNRVVSCKVDQLMMLGSVR